MLDLVAEVAADDVEHRTAVDVCRARQLTDVPAAAGLVLGLLLGEGVGLVREVAAEDDRVGPHVADDVGDDIGGQSATERLPEGPPADEVPQDVATGPDRLAP